MERLRGHRALGGGHGGAHQRGLGAERRPQGDQLRDVSVQKGSSSYSPIRLWNWDSGGRAGLSGMRISLSGPPLPFSGGVWPQPPGVAAPRPSAEFVLGQCGWPIASASASAAVPANSPAAPIVPAPTPEADAVRAVAPTGSGAGSRQRRRAVVGLQVGVFMLRPRSLIDAPRDRRARRFRGGRGGDGGRAAGADRPEAGAFAPVWSVQCGADPLLGIHLHRVGDHRRRGHRCGGAAAPAGAPDATGAAGDLGAPAGAGAMLTAGYVW